MNATNAITLKDYVDTRIRHIFDPATGRVESNRSEVLGEAGQHVAGFGSWRRVGILHRRQKIFVATYVHGSTLISRFGELATDWSKPGLRVEKKAIAPFVSQFSLFQGPRTLFCCKYVLIDWRDGPDSDIFSYVERVVRSREKILETTFIWAASAEGRNIVSQEFFDDLTRRVKEAVRSDFSGE